MRFFKHENGYAKVPAGETLEDMGVDPATAVEIPRMPRDHERWEDGAFVDDKPARDRQARRRRLHSLDRESLIDMIETVLDEMDDRLALLEKNAGATTRQKRKRIGD